MAQDCAILVLAAGASSRMRGGDKLLEQVAGAPLLRVMLERALDAGTGPVICTLPAQDHPRMHCLSGLDVQPVIVDDAGTGMAASIRAGVAVWPATCDGMMILPADMPDLEAGDLITVWQTWLRHPAQIIRATDASGAAGHPVVFPRLFAPDLMTLQGDRGARDLLHARAAELRSIALPACHATTDLDTPEAWAAWRARHT